MGFGKGREKNLCVTKMQKGRSLVKRKALPKCIQFMSYIYILLFIIYYKKKGCHLLEVRCPEKSS